MSVAEIEADELALEAPTGGLWRTRRAGCGATRARSSASRSSVLVPDRRDLRAAARALRPERSGPQCSSRTAAARARQPLTGSASTKVGRDEFSRIVYGARYSLMIGLVAVATGLSVGLLLGAIAGYFGGASTR